METKGLSPSEYGQDKVRGLTNALNKASTGLYGEIVKSMPVGVGGRLQRSWTLSPASESNPQTIIGTNSQYFLSVEMGRKPGKGISREGQDSVALWARRKLSLSGEEAKSLAFLLSRKYKKEGRKAAGLIGLAQPGSQGETIPQDLSLAVQGSLLNSAYKELQNTIKTL